MKVKKQRFPRALLKSLVKDIEKFIGDNEGRLYLLEIIEDIPYDVRPVVLEVLSSFYEKHMVYFFYLLKLEFGKEVETLCNRALGKYNMAGIDISPPQIFKGVFYKAYASCSRHTGKLAIDVAWDTGESRLHVECFYLTFNCDGIHSFFLIENMAKTRYEQERKVLADMVELSFEEVCFLVAKAYTFNLHHMNRPALGKFLYQKYLDISVAFSRSQELILIRKISQKLTPRQIVNSLFYALKHQDFDYISSLLYEYTLPGSLNDIINPGVIILEGQVQEVYGSHDAARVSAYSVFVEDRKLYRIEYCFYLFKNTAGIWWISDIDQVKRELVNPISEHNPLNKGVIGRVYEIIDLDGLFEILNTVDNIREIEELPYGMHMRVTNYEADLNHGVTFTTGVIADLVINGDEFVVISDDHSVVMDFHELLSLDNHIPVVLKGEYDVSLINACNYMSGQYIFFEDILLYEEDNFIFEDDMRFISARYLIKDKEQLLERVKKLENIKMEIKGNCNVYYQTNSNCGETGFFAEYIISSDWITISTFGDSDLKIARQDFEKRMYDCLEFDGLEVRDESIFDILTSDIKKQYPYLEFTLKEMYLNKWYHSHLVTLRGMSPSEAVETEEGTRLLWNMFKNLREKEKGKYFSGKKNHIDLKEYIRKVEQKKEKNI